MQTEFKFTKNEKDYHNTEHNFNNLLVSSNLLATQVLGIMHHPFRMVGNLLLLDGFCEESN